MRLACVLDIEGVVVPAGIDFAFFLVEYLSRLRPASRSSIMQKVKLYDEYDDARWKLEYLYSGCSSYQTGTTPLYVLLLCAGHSLCEHDVLRAGQVLAETCHRLGLVIDLRRLYSVYDEIYLASSSYHAFALKIAEHAGVSMDHVMALGHVESETPELIVKELLRRGSRSEILNSCTLLYYVAKNFLACGGSSKLHDMLLRTALASLRNVELSRYLFSKFVQQSNIAGSRAKAQLVSGLRRKNYTVIFVGDSIVDVEAALHANISIALNPSSNLLLHASTFTVLVQDQSRLVDLLEEIALSRDLSSLRGKARRLGLELYSKSEVSTNISFIELRAREIRETLKIRSREASKKALSDLTGIVEISKY